MKEEFFNKVEAEQALLLAQSNSSEIDVLKQVILVNSGALAITGAIVTSGGGISLLPQQILVTIAISLLLVSLANAIIYLTMSHLFFLNTHNFLENLVKVTKKIETSKQSAHWTSEIAKLKHSTNRVLFYISIYSLFIGVALLTTVILLNIW